MLLVASWSDRFLIMKGYHHQHYSFHKQHFLQCIFYVMPQVCRMLCKRLGQKIYFWSHCLSGDVFTYVLCFAFFQFREKTADKISYKNGDTVDEAALKTSIPDETEPVALKPKSQQIGERIPPINATSAEASRNDDYLLSHYSEISSSPQSLQSRGVSDDKIIKENT